MKKFKILTVLLTMTCSAFASLPVIDATAPGAASSGYSNGDISTNGEKLVLKHFLRPGQIVFDVGASVGNWALIAREVEPKIQLFCFEPVPYAFLHLVNNLMPFTEKLYNFAFSSNIGQEDFYYFDAIDWSEGSSFFLRDHFPIEKVKKMQIKTDTLDNFCEQYQIEKIDYLKIDTEGGELRILMGARKYLTNHQIIALQFEYGGTYPDAGITLKECMALLTYAGYAIFRISAHGIIHISRWHPSLENGMYANYFAILQSEMPQYNLVDFGGY